MAGKPDNKLPAQSDFGVPDLNVNDVQADEDPRFLIHYSDDATYTYMYGHPTAG